MKIKGLDIYGYGKIIDKSFKIEHDFVQVFGENEAGKSTMMSFIHSILFGFPRRNEGEPRREPRLGNAYGGRLIVQFVDEVGPVTIERIKGNKSAGDVRITMADGTERSENWLKRKLNYIDKEMYRSIFSFDVLGLQDINKNLTEKDLQDYLLRAGALGSNKYEDMLNAINTKLDELYKRNGTKPDINVKIDSISNMTEKIAELESYEETYESLVSEKHKIIESIERKRHSVNSTKQQLKNKMKEIMYHPEIKEWQSLANKIDVEPALFPEKGIERYEALKNHLTTGQKDKLLRQEKLEALIREENRVVLPEEDTLNYLERLSKEEPNIKHELLELERLQSEVATIEEKIHRSMNDIGWQEEHLDVDDSNIVRENVQSLLSRHDEIEMESEFYNNSIAQLKDEIKETDKKLESFSDTQISNQRIRAKLEVQDLEHELKEKERVYHLIEDKYFEEEKKREARNKTQGTVIISMSVILMLIGLSFIFISNQNIYGIIFIVVGLLSLLLLKLNKTEEEDDHLKDEYEQDLEKLKQQIKEKKEAHDLNFDYYDAREMMNEVDRHMNKKLSDEIKLESLEEKRSILDSTNDQLKRDLARVKEKLYVSDELENAQIVDTIYTIRNIKQMRRNIDELNTRIEAIDSNITQFSNSVREEVSKYGIDFHINSIFFETNKLLEKLLKDKSTYHNLREQINLFENEIDVIDNRNYVAEKEMKELFNYVGADDEDEYYYYGRMFTEFKENEARFKELNNKLTEENFDLERRQQLSEFNTADLRDEETALNTMIENYENDIDEETTMLAKIEQDIKHLEKNGQLSVLRHQYELEKNSIETSAVDYMSLMYIKTLIEAHIKAIKDKRLPIVVEEARKIFEYITKERYIDVMYEDNIIKVKHSNGQIFDPSEISQSTKELLYIALRISLIKALKNYYNLPIIIDDAFVHFDQTRTRTILDYFKKQSEEHQVLFFTCNLEKSIPSTNTIVLQDSKNRR
ncbi:MULTISPECIES: ATP-binding protein [Nosocomiicoccus]|uniref:AAA family ATPase n=1 Tax=Nosocomiicoccus massiliensis TaxID=1232430 RepID=A0AAF1BTC0_9STAP|nr:MULTISPECIES: AAA family ATPase [Nosocomiicoccus]OFL46369.1 hypothetical protein HMPREF2767_05570 [Nosocomiicoccus sp. HMSC067E10]WOS96802.1 AAA family ATPase [Nosocomiicoccus massiliensis]